MQKLTFKPGFTTCPACSIKGTPQEPYMAVPTGDDRVYCHACELVSSALEHFAEKGKSATLRKFIPDLQSLPAPLLDIVISLLTTKVGEDGSTPPTYVVSAIGAKGLGFSEPMTDYDMTRASGAVAQDAAAYLIEEARRFNIAFSSGPYGASSLTLSYQPEHLAGALEATEDYSDLAAPLLDRLRGDGPEASAVSKLARVGFRPRHCDLDSAIRNIAMYKGSAASGVAAKLSWY